PAITPHYTLPQYSPYQWVKKHGIPEAYKSSHFAPATVRKIQDAAGQELATHTFSHFYCLELQDHPLAFEADLQAAKLAAHHFNNVPRSMVFPRNQYNSQYLKRCYEQGITAVRTNPSATFWRPVTNKGAGIFRKLIRTADAYVQVSRQRSSYPLSEIVCKPGEPLQLKASRFLRPWNTKYPFVHHWLLQRICREMKIAAALGECYHLWWHPENFGDHPKENMAGLRVLLEQYKQCANRYGMQSWNMAEYASNLLTTGGTITTHQYAGSAG
ncbi:MAG TPA: hypothetical protein VL307_18095, partial [Chitinophagaceae bacterium]|nr:hypothetical protein [Chitinophagaceae bacterium]